MGSSELPLLTSGSNVVVAPVLSVVAMGRVGSAEAVDGQALLLDASGKVRSDADFVFFNAPRHPSNAVSIRASVGGAAVEVDLTRIEPGVRRIVLCLSADDAVSEAGGRFRAIIEQRGQAVAEFSAAWPAGIAALMVGEFYRRGDAWKFRAIGQGWNSGLAGLATDFGVAVDDDTSPPVFAPGSPEPAGNNSHLQTSGPPDRRPQQTGVTADWYPDSANPGAMRWWDGRRWTEHSRWIYDNPQICPRCGQPLRTRRLGGGTLPCRPCETQIVQFMQGWRSRAWQVLNTNGPRGEQWQQLWQDLRFEQIPPSIGREQLGTIGLAYLEQLAAFAFADGEIEDSELASFDAAVHDLELAPSRQLLDLQQRMQRGRIMTQVRAGELPRIQSPNLHLDSDEFAYLDSPANRVRYLASGTKYDSGRLVVSNRKVRFVGHAAGTEIAWNKIMSVRAEYQTVVISATTARGGGTYAVHDPDYVAAILEGALRIAKRLILAPGQRDTRAIPQHVRNEVWQRDGGRCTQCGDAHYLEFDHIIPLSRGGATSVTNLQILCRNCNLAKGARI